MRNIIKNFIVVLVIFLIASAIFGLVFQPFQKTKEISLTELVKDINDGKVDKITVSSQDLYVSYKDNTKAHSVKESESSLSVTLSNYGADKNKISLVNIEQQKPSGLENWLSPILLILPVILFGVFFFLILRQAKSGAMQAFNFSKARARLFGADGYPKERITFHDVAGLKEAKEELKEIVDFLKNPRKYLQMGARIPKGVLLTGMPGTGKTMLARAVAGEANVPFFSISGSEFVELFVGVGAGRVRDLFSTAKKHQPCIIYIDELDAIGRIRGAGIGGGHDEREQTLNQILVEMDGFERNINLIVMSSTNRPDVLDPALLRPGRFDRKIILDLPDVNDREEILKIHSRGKPLASNANLREVAERTPGFSGADLANLANEAALLAARRNKKEIGEMELLESIEKVLLGPERKSHILSNKEKRITAFHESGHALVASLIPGTEPIRKISIVSRGFAAGYTIHIPSEEKRMKTKSEFLADLSILLGGYCAEQIKFGDITTGSSNDLKKSSDIARSLVKEYGMSSLGPISFGEKEEMIFLGRQISEERNYSEKISALIDEEVDKFVKEAQDRAMKLLKKNISLLDKIANTLIQKETIEKEEFEKLIQRKK